MVLISIGWWLTKRVVVGKFLKVGLFSLKDFDWSYWVSMVEVG